MEPERVSAPPVVAVRQLQAALAQLLAGRGTAAVTVGGIRGKLAQHFGLSPDALDERGEELQEMTRKAIKRLPPPEDAPPAPAPAALAKRANGRQHWAIATTRGAAWRPEPERDANPQIELAKYLAWKNPKW